MTAPRSPSSPSSSAEYSSPPLRRARIFFSVEQSTGRRPSFERFLREGMATMTGRSSGRDALIQMLIVPVMLTFGVIAMGIAPAVIFEEALQSCFATIAIRTARKASACILVMRLAR